MPVRGCLEMRLNPGDRASARGRAAERSEPPAHLHRVVRLAAGRAATTKRPGCGPVIRSPGSRRDRASIRVRHRRASDPPGLPPGGPAWYEQSARTASASTPKARSGSPRAGTRLSASPSEVKSCNASNSARTGHRSR
jgi:hypothetical protein